MDIYGTYCIAMACPKEQAAWALAFLMTECLRAVHLPAVERNQQPPCAACKETQGFHIFQILPVF